MKNTKLIKLLGVSLLIGGLVACGSGGGGSTPTPEPEPGPVTPAKDPSLNFTEKSIKVGDEFTLTVSDVPEGEIPVWSVSGTAVSFTLESIVKADSAKVKGLEAGESLFTILVGSFTLNCKVTVTDSTPTPGPGPSGGTTVEIDFWHTFGQTIVDNLQPQIDKFVKLVKDNENVDVTVNLVPCSNYQTINENISSGLNTGNIPTLAVAYPDHIADYLEAEGGDIGKFMVNLDDYIENDTYGLGTESYLGDVEGDSLDDIIPAYLEGGQSYVREGTYSFPYMKSTEAMLYNYDAVQKVLKDYKPEFQGAKAKIVEYMNNLDWEEFMELCRQTIAHKDIINPALKAAAFYDSDSNMFISQMLQSGIGYSSIITNTAGKKVGHIDFAEGDARTKAEALVTKLKGWYDENQECHLFTTKGAFSTYGSDSFKNIESVFTIGSTGGSGYSLTGAFEIGVCKVPSMDSENPLYVTQGPDLCIMRNPKLSDKANEMKSLYSWKLLKYLTNAENNCSICLLGSEGYLPVRQSAYEQDLYLSFIETGEIQADIANLVVEDIDGKYFNTACFPGSATLRTEVGGIVTLALTDNTKTITSIFDTAIENAILKIK